MSEAVDLYDKCLRDLEEIVGDDTTYLGQLERIGKQLFGKLFHGVYAADDIPNLSSAHPYAILNLDKTSEPGSHWVSIAHLEKGGDILFYDSFGRMHTSL